MKHITKIIAAAIVCAVLIGCSRANLAAMTAWGSRHKVTLYSGGVAVRTWEATGKVENEDRSDGYYFQDVSGKLISVSGNVVVEQE